MQRSKKSKKPGSNKDKKQKYRNQLEKNSRKEIVNGINGEQEVSDVDTKKKGKERFEQTFSVKTSDVMGRYLVAAKDFRAGDMILNEEAIVVGPCQGSKPICLICYRSIIPSEDVANPIPDPVPCEKCSWPLCGVESCLKLRKDPEAKTDHSEECKAFSAALKNGRKTEDPLAYHSLYEAIVPLRCLLLKDSAPEKWEAICRMESHDAIRKTRPNIWDINQTKVVDRIRGPWGLADKFSEDEIHTVCGALEVNAFEVGRNKSSLRALFGPNAYLIAHDCVPNTSHVDMFEAKSLGKSETEAGIFRLQVRTSTPVQKGGTFYLSYAYTLQGTMARREHVRESKFFSCSCERCKDPTELGTYLSALKCPLCELDGSKGNVLPKDPLNEDAEWICDTCGRYKVQSSTVSALIERITAEVESLSSDDVGQNEAFLQRYQNVLGQTHYLVVGVKHSLSQIYGRMSGYTIPELPRSLLERKRDICRELLQIFDVIEPGKSRLRGITLYELHAPLMTMITRNLEEGKINAKKDKKELKKQLLEVCRCLEEAKEILFYEPPKSSEGSIAIAASDALKELRKWISTLT